MTEIFFASLLFLFIGHVFGTFKDIGGDELGETTDDDIYVCYHMMHCKLGDEGYKMAKECHNMMIEEDWKIMWEMYAEEGFSQFVNKYADELTKLMCPMEDDDKKNLFEAVSVKLTKGLSAECAKNSRGDKCKHGQEVMDCFGNKINQLKMDKKCGVNIDSIEKKN